MAHKGPWITVSGLVDYMTTMSQARQREIVENFKYPDSEGVRRANYYQVARDAI